MQNRLLFLFFFICLLFTYQLSLSQNLNYKHFTTQDGLPSMAIYEAFQDHQGFMWFATAAGVSRFDGYRFTNYTIEDGLGDNEIFGFFEDSFNRIWCRSLNGKVSYFFDGKFHNSENTPNLRGLDKPSNITRITETLDHSLLITHAAYGFCKYATDGKITEFRLYKPNSYFNNFAGAYKNSSKGYTVLGALVMIKLFSDGSLRSATRTYRGYNRTEFLNGQYFISSVNSLYKLDKANLLPATYIMRTEGMILNLNKEGNDLIWLSTAKGAVCFNIKVNEASASYLKDNQVSSVIRDNEHNLWFTTLDNGLFILTNQDLKNYTMEDGLSSNKVFSINKDSDGSLWLGHDNFVVTQIKKDGKVSQKKILEHAPAQLQPSIPHINQITKTNSEFFVIGTPASFYLCKNKITILNYLKGKSISKWYDETYLIAGGSTGLKAFSKKRVEKFQENKFQEKNSIYSYPVFHRNFNAKTILTQRANCLYRQGEGKLWIGTDDGLVYLTRDTTINYYDQYPLLHDRTLDIKEDRAGVLYVATDSKGIIILKNKKIMQLTKKDGLSSNSCHKIELDDNILWVATNAGVDRITLNENLSPKKTFTINTEQGLPSNDIHDILIDNEKVWIATSGGLSVANKSINNVNYKPPITYVTIVSVNNQLTDTLQHEFNYKQNNIRIDFVGLSFKSKADIRYKYKLSRSKFSTQESESWQNTKNTSVDLSLLPPGHYKFEVKAQNSSGIWGQSAFYNFTIQPPFWNTWWFILILLTSIVVGTFYAWKYAQNLRSKKLKNQRTLQFAELKSLQSQMNYHFMSNAFNSLQGLFSPENGVDKYLGKFSKLMRFTLENSDRHLIPLSEELDYLTLYCDIEQLRIGDRFLFQIEYDKLMKSKQLLVPALTLQPFVENAIWHGVVPNESLCTINLRVVPHDESCYNIIIEDDGIGINTSLANKAKTNRKSFGTKLILDRFEIINHQSKSKAKLSIEDRFNVEQQNGTRVTITLPYDYA